MTPLAFFRSAPAQAAIRRAARIAGCPISLHTVRAGVESPRILSTGACAACTLVNAHGSGRTRCADARVPHSAMAMARQRPVPFVCHMGFACVSVAPLAAHGEPFVLTLGPYCSAPSHRPESAAQAYAATERTAQRALTTLGIDCDDAVALLGDLPTVPADVVPGVAEWLAETLQALWHSAEGAPESAGDPPPPALRTRTGRSKRPEQDPYAASAIAASAMAGDRAGARRLIAVALGETRGNARVQAEARLNAVAAATVEALAQAGAAAPSWGCVAGSLKETLATREPKEWPAILARLLTTGPSAPVSARTDLTARVDALLDGHVADAPSLNNVAATLGCTPSAVTHALQRKFGMSYTQYVGRLRVAAAKDLLRRTRLSPSEVGRRIGIGDASNFTRLFKKFEGITPLEYRARFGVKR